MNNLNGAEEGKQYFKSKVGHLMEKYQLFQKEEILQKQQLKQNIMLKIMQNRVKQPHNHNTNLLQKEKSQTSQTNFSDPSPQELDFPDIPQITFNPNQIKPKFQPSPVSDPQRMDERRGQEKGELKVQEITFNMKQRNKSLEEELKYRDNFQPEDESPQPNQDSELTKSVNRIARFANKYFPESFKYPEEVKKQRQEDGEMPKAEWSEYSNLSSYKVSKNRPADGLTPSEYKKSYYQEQEDEEEEIRQAVQEVDQRGVFLTMEESESMSASEMAPKNCAFQIKMDKSVDPDHLQELRKQKIREMQRRRQETIEQYRKNASQKKVQVPKPRHSLKQQKQLPNQVELPPPKSTTIDRKTNMHRPPKMQNRSERQPKHSLVPLQPHQSQYEVKGSKRSSNANLRSHQKRYNEGSGFIEEYPPKALSPLRTPKAIQGDNRSKSSNRNFNIFTGESQYQRQKSATRMAQPKIEPKERKNSFTRQSNKKLMINAITYVCFPGELNRKERERLVEVLESSEHQFFIFLFKEYSRKIIKGIYTLDPSQTKLLRIYGDKAPPDITADRVHEFYRFDSGSREFKKVDGCRSFSLAIHAVDLR